MKKFLSLSTSILFCLFYLAPAYADSLIDGVYVSPAGENGKVSCTLTISSLGDEPKYGDQFFQLESSGDGACEWSAVGMSKNYAITAGSVTSGGAQTFISLKFPFGPAGKRINLAAYDLDGSLRNEEMYIQDEALSNVD